MLILRGCDDYSPNWYLIIITNLRLPEIQSNYVKTPDSVNYLSTNCMTVHSTLYIFSSDYPYEITRTIPKLCECSDSTGHCFVVVKMELFISDHLTKAGAQKAADIKSA